MLNVKQVEKLNQPGRHMDGGGLHLLITPRGGKSWVLRYQLNGKRHDLGFGPAAEITLAAARDAATDARRLIRAGQDPLAARRGSVAAAVADAALTRTFGEVFAAYLEANAAKWTNA